MTFEEWYANMTYWFPLLALSRSSSRWDFHFHSYVLTIYARLYWILELVVFYSLVRRRYIRKVSVQLVPKYFSRVCSTDSFSCSERKKLEENKVKKRQQNKRSKIKTLLSSPIHLAHHRSAVAPISLRCCTNIATLSLCCRSVVTLMLHRYHTAIVPLSPRLCCSVVALMSHRYRSTISLLLSLLLSIRSRTAIAPLPRRCRTAVAPAQRGYK